MRRRHEATGLLTAILWALAGAAGEARADAQSNYQQAAQLSTLMAAPRDTRGFTATQVMALQLQQNAAKQAAKRNERGAESSKQEEPASKPMQSSVPFPQLPQQILPPTLPSSSSSGSEAPAGASGGGDSQFASIQQYEEEIRKVNKKIREGDRAAADLQIAAIQQGNQQALLTLMNTATNNLKGFQAQPKGELSVEKNRGGTARAGSAQIGSRNGRGRNGDPLAQALAEGATPSSLGSTTVSTTEPATGSSEKGQPVANGSIQNTVRVEVPATSAQ